MKLHQYIFLAIIILSPRNLLSSFIYGNGLKDSALMYTFAMGGLIAHELGHALVAKTLWGSPIDITLGAQPDEPDKKPKEAPIFQFRGIQLKSLNPFAGGFALASGCPPDTDTSYKAQYEKLAFFAAGPVAGFTFLWSACTCFNICSCRSYNVIFGCLMLHQIKQLFYTADQITDTQNGKVKSDGEHILEALRIVRRKRAHLEKI